MKISASVHNHAGKHQAVVRTNDQEQSITIPPRAAGQGSAVNGGELLFLALATCYCNDIYREAAKMGIVVEQVEVEVQGEFGGVGEPAQAVTYSARIAAQAGRSEIEALLRHTDTVAEIHNTLRVITPVTLSGFEIIHA